MKKLFAFFSFLTTVLVLNATTPLYTRDGIELSQSITKEKTIFCSALNKNIIFWKSIVTIKNTTPQAVNLLKPVYLKYNRGFLTNSEMSAIRLQNIGYDFSQTYRNNLTSATSVLTANQTLTNQKYFVTYENIDLSKEGYIWDLQYVK